MAATDGERLKRLLMGLTFGSTAPFVADLSVKMELPAGSDLCVTVD
jgi:hypothetical protein